MKRSRDYDDNADDDMNPTEKVKTDLMADEFEDEPGYLKLDNIDRKVWLVKVPKFLFDKWSAVKEEGVNLGELKIKNVPSSKNAYDVTLELDNRFSKDLPKNYKLQFTNISPKTGFIPTNEYVFTDNDKGAGYSIEGIVNNEATISPIVDEHYRKIMAARTSAAAVPKRQIQILDEDSEKRAHRTTTSTGNSFAMQPQHKKTVQEKRERLPREEVNYLLFQLFEQYPYWNLKGLIEQTHQPQSYLKEILGDIAQLERRGTHVGFYRLKKEFRNQQKDKAEEEESTTPKK